MAPKEKLRMLSLIAKKNAEARVASFAVLFAQIARVARPLAHFFTNDISLIL